VLQDRHKITENGSNGMDGLSAQRCREGGFSMKSKILFIAGLMLALITFSALSGCSYRQGAAYPPEGSGSGDGDHVPEGFFAAGTDTNKYVWEKPGFGGSFTITLKNDGTYQYYEGYYSSYIGVGTWTYGNGVITMNEDEEFCGNDRVFRFKVSKEGLNYIANGSDSFISADVTDGDRFLLRGADAQNG